MNFLEQFFSDTFMPHGYCFQWRPDILWVNVISDFLIAVAYFTIPVAIVIITRKRDDLEFKGVFVLFALFILCCGLTHLLSIYTVWHASYGLAGLMKAITAVVSLLTAFVVYKNLNKALTLPSPAQLAQAVHEREVEMSKTMQMEIQRKADAIFRFTTELMPTGLLVVDANQKIILVNEALATLFGYEMSELEGKDISTLLEDSMGHHKSLVSSFLEKPEQFHSMAAGRAVRGLRKNGESVDVQINLAVHEYESEQHAFASVTDLSAFIFEQTKFNEQSTRLRRAIDASNDGIWEWKVQTNEVWYSPQFMTLIGKRASDTPLFESWKNHVHPEDWPSIELQLNKHLAKEGKYDLSYRGIAENGQYEWFHTRGDTLFDDEGKPILMSGTLSNINETKELEYKLAEQTQFLNQVLDRSLTGMYIFDLKELKNIYINPEYTNLTGYTVDDLESVQANSNLLPLFHPDDQAAMAAHLQEVIEDKLEQGVGIEYRFLHKDGSWRWFFSRDAIYSVNENGEPLKLLGSFFDITELKLREQEIRKLALDYSTTFEQAGVGIAHVKLDGSFIKINKKMTDILGYELPELLAKKFQDLTHHEDVSKSIDALKELSSGAVDSYETEKRYIQKSGAMIWAHVTVSIARDHTNEPYLISVIEDITQRKEMENRISESNTALERFAYSASHDLQEPLRKISAFSGALERRIKDHTDDEEIISLLDRVSNAAVRMSNMVDNLLELSRATRSSIEIKHISLSSIIALSLYDLSTKLEAVDAKINLVQDGYIDADPNAFSQVIRNLISNSINYRREEVPLEITIEIKIATGVQRIYFSDNGSGIPSDKADQVFEPFKRLVGRQIPGTGMGLAICRQIIMAHRGTITVASPKYYGTTFAITLPVINTIEA